jgi:hypothetical protein
MRFRTPELFLGALLTVAVFSVGILFSSRFPHTATQSATQHEIIADSDSAKKPDVDLGWGAWLWKDASGFFTFGLVLIGVSQAILFLSQLKLIRDSLDEASTIAKSAALAANLNAQAVVDAERARLFVIIDQENVTQMIKIAAIATDPEDRTNYALRLSYSFKNYGRTPALIQEVSHRAIFAPDFPVLREYEAVLDLPFANSRREGNFLAPQRRHAATDRKHWQGDRRF